jgi:RNA polymerase sigma-70 factor (ECF subfamily)
VLLEQIRAGDQAALDLLLDAVPARARALGARAPAARRPRSVRHRGSRQETIIGVLRHLDHFEFRGEGALHAYLRRAMLNRIRDELRRHSRRGSAETLDERFVCADDSPLEQVIGREAVERYETALAQLTSAEREAIIARIELGQTFAEVAGALGKPTPEAARMAVNRALARLARLMLP